MGYPLTWQRFVRRNKLTDGSYAATPVGWATDVNTSDTIDPRAALDIVQAQRLRLLRYAKQASLLAGDLRRLEADAQDEQALCEHVSQRTGLGVDAVATVLKEFFAI